MMPGPGSGTPIQLSAGADVVLDGLFEEARDPVGLVLVAQAASAGRFSGRSDFVAHEFRERGLATLRLDLLTPEEDRDYAARFDLPLLARRWSALCREIRDRLEAPDLHLGVFSVSTGAGAALLAATEPGAGIDAIVSCEGRPDLLEELLPAVEAPTLLVTGARAVAVTELNARAYRLLAAPKDMIVLPTAANVFEEPGALAEVLPWAGDWYRRFLSPS